MTAAALTPMEEEREALRQYRHMERMQREAERTRERERRTARRAAVREARARLAEADRTSAAAMRAYHRALDALAACPETDEMKLALRLRQCDRAFDAAITASYEATFYRRRLEEANRG